MLFSLTVYTKSENIRTIPYCGYNWFYNENSASNTLNKGFNPNLDIKNVLDKIAAIIPKDFSETKLVKFFIKKFTLYWLLDGGRHSTSEEFLRQYKEINDWVKINGMKSTLSVFNREIRDERLMVKLAIFTMNLIEKVGLLKLFAKLYCKG